jgi:hypothetical protein
MIFSSSVPGSLTAQIVDEDLYHIPVIPAPGLTGGMRHQAGETGRDAPAGMRRPGRRG